MTILQTDKVSPGQAMCFVFVESGTTSGMSTHILGEGVRNNPE